MTITIREARERAGLTQGDVAVRMGVSFARFSDIERGRKPARLETVLAVAAAIGCDPHELDPRLASVRPGG
jgi:transcriptional regulator with XRE-family HTH domain